MFSLLSQPIQRSSISSPHVQLQPILLFLSPSSHTPSLFPLSPCCPVISDLTSLLVSVLYVVFFRLPLHFPPHLILFDISHLDFPARICDLTPPWLVSPIPFELLPSVLIDPSGIALLESTHISYDLSRPSHTSPSISPPRIVSILALLNNFEPHLPVSIIPTVLLLSFTFSSCLFLPMNSPVAAETSLALSAVLILVPFAVVPGLSPVALVCLVCESVLLTIPAA